MGGFGSVPKSLYSPEELEEISKVKELQTFGLDFIKREIFHDIPIRSGKKSEDPTAALWIEPLPVDPDRLDRDGPEKVTEEILQGFPTGALVDRKGKFKVLFSMVDVEYTFDKSDAERYMAQCKTMEGLPEPQPPTLTEATTSSVAIRWSNSLPFPPGIIQAVELQYTTAPNPNLSGGNSQTLEIDKSARTASSKSDSSPPSPSRWFSLVSRTYAQNQFDSYKWSGLTPGSHYTVRMRYRTSGINWSEYSQPSAVFSTLADRPRTPTAPVCVPITFFAVQIVWGPTNQAAGSSTAMEATAQRRALAAENGSPIFEYLLVGKSVGEEDFVELYRGPNKTHLVLGLFAEIAYTFKLAAVNSVGMSAFSPPVSVQTPSRPVRSSSVARSIAAATAAGIDLGMDFGRAICVREADADREVAASSGFTPAQIQIARQCREAWREYWDSSSEQTFYFNSILSVRQLEVPAVLRDPSSRLPVAGSTSSQRTNHSANASTQLAVSGKEGPTANATTLDSNSPEILFRKKRYRLLHSLRKKTSNYARSKDIVHLELERPSMLADCFREFKKLNALDFRRRVKVSFIGEQGLDSGGLSKEAFLLLSKQAAYYAGPRYHQWLCTVVSSQLVSREPNRKVVVNTTATADRSVAAAAAVAQEPSLSLNPTDTEKKEVEPLEAMVEEPVEGYFITPKSAAIRSAPAAPSEEKADTGMAEACFQTIITLDTEQKITSVQFFQFLGRLLGKALYDRQLVDFPLSSLLLKHLLGEIASSSVQRTGSSNNSSGSSGNGGSKAISESGAQSKRDADLSIEVDVLLTPADAATKQMLHELRYLDKELHQSLQWMCENDITDVIYETFSVSNGETDFPLCAHGETLSVTEANKLEYIRLMIQWKTTYSVAHNLFPFLEAFHEIIPLAVLQKAELTPEELNLMLNGKREVDVEELRAFCIYQGLDTYFNETHDGVIWFWQAVRSFSQGERRSLLKFFTGSGRVPLDGFDPPLNVTQGSDMALNSLPRAHTCFNQIVLPKYSSYEMCLKQMRFAMENTAGFDFA